MCYACANRDSNRELPSGLIAEDRTRQLLEIAIGERNYRVAMSKENLRAIRPWAFVKETPCTTDLPVKLLLTLL